MGLYLPSPAGVTSPGVAPDGLKGQYLRKASDIDFDTEWVDVEIPEGGSEGDGGAGHDAVSLHLSVADIFDLSGQQLRADDPGASRLIFWDDVAGKLEHLAVSDDFSIESATLKLAGSENYGSITVGTTNTIDYGGIL